ncbi:hypothetical protein H0484_00905 [Pusillimonas sp. CC-YST705]|uniref:Uncharacterized protein n=1 Tax=Mesopusillimonas faecipullorum TaxID=2755040 RepID=A0ABS8C8I1_9BURK|nr:hypothetical protein [Mesopusillimonas faecipullorum]MCB5362321.1 hypothetical protein [Mesopusillimonas faecipullorum]
MKTSMWKHATGATRRAPWFAIVPVLVLMFVLTACGGSSSDPDPVPEPDASARATVLVYIVGSDLEGPSDSGKMGDQATGNLAEMMTVGSSSDVHVIVETGGANKKVGRRSSVSALKKVA